MKAVPVVVFTTNRDIWFGYAAADDVEVGSSVIRLERIKHVSYFSEDVKGPSGLALHGPGRTGKVGDEAPSGTIRDVAAVLSCTKDAAEAFAQQGWGRRAA